jgi:hypothetical protein
MEITASIVGMVSTTRELLVGMELACLNCRPNLFFRSLMVLLMASG